MSYQFDDEIKCYESMNEELPPPCHGELMASLFEIYKDGKVLSNGKFRMPIDLIREEYPEIEESDLQRIIDYLKETERFCEDVCCCLSRCIDVPFVPPAEEEQQRAARVKQVCLKRYPWMEEEQIEELLNTVCWLSNR
ncbi:MAG: hypothetical protein K1W26_10565 [Acetatifactor sp.]